MSNVEEYYSKILQDFKNLEIKIEGNYLNYLKKNENFQLNQTILIRK
jgi:hypothetical protein